MNSANAAQIDRNIRRRFEIMKKLGQGGYGIVWKAYDKRIKKIVALKKVIEGFRNRTDAQRTYREIMLLHELEHENIVRLYDVLKAENDNDIYLVFEFMDTDLAGVLRCNLLTEVHKRYVLYQLCRSLHYMHTSKVLHRDLKPSNLLMNEDCKLKVCDFGLARVVSSLNCSPANEDEEEEEQDSNGGGGGKNLTLYQATRWYSPPEVLLGSTNYSGAVDMWGVGCIMAEMFTKNCVPLFRGTNTQNQIMKILEVSIPQGTDDIEAMNSPTAEQFLKSLPRHVFTRPVDQLTVRCPDLPADGVELLQKLLAWNPSRRLTAAECMQHPFFAQFYKDEHISPSGLDIKMPIDDDKKLSVSAYRSELYNLIEKKQQQEKAKGILPPEEEEKEEPAADDKNKDADKKNLKRTKSARANGNKEKVVQRSNKSSTDLKSQIKDKPAEKGEDLKKERRKSFNPSSAQPAEPEADGKQKRRSYHFGSPEDQVNTTIESPPAEPEKKEKKLSFFQRLLSRSKKNNRLSNSQGSSSSNAHASASVEAKASSDSEAKD